jgi:hypothetical protein
MAYKPLPSFSKLSQYIKYDPYCGIGVWLMPPNNRVKIGAIAGKINNGYAKITFQRKTYMAHRLFWLLHTGYDPGQLTVDHIDQNKTNNKFNNLRLATLSEQQRNICIRANNKSGHRGVYWNAKNQKYEAQITNNQKLMYIGQYDTLNAAIAARQAKELEIYGEFSPLHQLKNDQRLIIDNNDQQLSFLRHTSF